MTGFEPATPSSQARCATKLRYIPKNYLIVNCSVHLNSVRLGATSPQTTFSCFRRQSQAALHPENYLIVNIAFTLNTNKLTLSIISLIVKMFYFSILFLLLWEIFQHTVYIMPRCQNLQTLLFHFSLPFPLKVRQYRLLL